MKKTILITGAGSGIGRATAIVMASQPDTQLILIGRRAEELEKTQKQLNRSEEHFICAFDVRDKLEWRKALQDISASSLNFSGLFANAGIGGENKYGEEDRWSDIISTNLDGTYITIKECLPYFKISKEKYKHVVITSSCLARFGVPKYTAYCTAKAGLLGLTKSLAVELAQDNILVNAICPGWVETEMAQAGIQMLADATGNPYGLEFEQQMSYVPLQKMSQPEEIGQLVSFLMSNLQTSMTGQSFDINNGSFMI